MRVRKYHRWPVRLSCGHDTMVTPAQIYGGSAACPACPGATALQRSRPITGRLTLTPALGHEHPAARPGNAHDPLRGQLCVRAGDGLSRHAEPVHDLPAGGHLVTGLQPGGSDAVLEGGGNSEGTGGFHAATVASAQAPAQPRQCA